MTRRGLAFSVNETALRASVRMNSERSRTGASLFQEGLDGSKRERDDRPVAVSNPSLFVESVVQPEVRLCNKE